MRTKKYQIESLITSAKQWSKRLNNGGQSESNISKSEDALVSLMPKITKSQAIAIRALISAESNSAYWCGVRDGKLMGYQKQEIEDSGERPENVIKFA